MSSDPNNSAEPPDPAERLRPLVVRLVVAARARGHLPPDESDRRLVRNLLAALALSLRTDPPPTDHPGVIDSVLAVRAVRFLAPGVRPPHVPPTPDAADDQVCGGFHIRRWCRPLGRVGGDLTRVAATGGRVWALMADVTGHGLGAHVLTAGLAWLWNTVMAELGDGDGPAVAADRMEAELAPHLPEGVFVEAAVVRAEQAVIEVLAAGAVRWLAAATPADLPAARTLSGQFFGLPTAFGMPADRGADSVELAPGGEVLFATDGVFDRPYDGDIALKDRLPDEWRSRRPACLHSAVVEGYCRSDAPAEDDASVLTFRRVGGDLGPGGEVP
jgi:hypothetical protein